MGRRDVQPDAAFGLLEDGGASTRGVQVGEE